MMKPCTKLSSRHFLKSSVFRYSYRSPVIELKNVLSALVGFDWKKYSLMNDSLLKIEFLIES